MPGPPTQKGKFKPRKPAKKVRAGAAAAVPDSAPSSASTSAPPAAAAAAAATASTATAAAAATEASAGRGSGRGGRAGRGGREGRGRGRGRGRAPQPQGQVYFTAAPTQSKKPAKSSGGSSGGKASTSKKDGDNDKSSNALLGKRKETETEEVVGQLESAIGSQLGKEEKKSVLENFDSDFHGPSKYDNEEQGGGTSRMFTDDGYTYDSDSSLEEAKPKPRSTNIPPTRLPFPVAPFPNGVGAKDKDSRPAMYDDQQPKSAEEEKNQPIIPIARNAAASERNQPSPFVDVNDVEALRSEIDSFFLFQFPTRLPALTQQVAGTGKGKAKKSTTNTTNEDVIMLDGNDDADAKVVEQSSGPIPLQTSDVVTAPVKPGSFDNVMSGAVPGRLGKLLVYKSGKTVLVFQGPNGSPEIRMNVSEGLTCGFEQQAVMIDPDKGRYVKLGNVHKTAVVTPDLDEAFQE